MGHEGADLGSPPLMATRLPSAILDAVRGVIEANRTRKHANPELMRSASRDPNANPGIGGNVSPTAGKPESQ